MAKTKKNRNNSKFNQGISIVTSLLDQLSTSVYGTDMKDETDFLNERFDKIIDDGVRSLSNDGSNDYNSFIGQLYSNDRDIKDISNRLTTELMLDDASFLNPADFITERYKNRMIMQADAHQIAEQLIELSEARSTMCDAILSSDKNTGRISRKIIFHDTNGTRSQDNYQPIVESMETHFGLQRKIKEFIVKNCLDYGSYYVYTIPYHLLFNGFVDKYKRGVGNRFHKSMSARRFFESAENDPTIESIEEIPFVESGDDAFFTSSEKTIRNILNIPDRENYPEINQELKQLADRITVSTQAIPIPILEHGIDAFKSFREEYISESGDKIRQRRNNNGHVEEDGALKYLRSYGNEDSSEGFFHDSNNDKETFTDLKDCYMKLCAPTVMFPIKLMSQTICYIYIQTEEATPLNTILSYSNQMRVRDSTNRLDNLIEDIANRIVMKFDKKFVQENKNFKEFIAAALEYYELGNQKIHFQVIPKEFVTEFKINADEDGYGHPMLEKSLFYAKLYLMILMFKIMSIVTKSNDQTINYIRTSGIDKNVFNKAQEIAREKVNRRINLNDMFNYTGLLHKVASGSEIFMPMGKNNEKPIESEILQGQSIELHSDLLEHLRNNYILASGVPSAIMNYLNEADFAKSIETANTKMCGRVMSYQMDLNPSITELYRKLLRFSTTIPESVIDSIDIALLEPKGTSNNISQEHINNYQSLESFFVKLYFGESPDDDKHVKRFTKELAKLHLEMINFQEIDKIFDITKLESVGDKVNGDSDDLAEMDM